MRVSWTNWTLLAGLFSGVLSLAQTVHQVEPAIQPSGAYVAFKFDWDQGRPWTKYTISVDDAGNAHFEGVGNPADAGDGDSYSLDFTMSDSGRQKIFTLARQTDYFRGQVEIKQKNIAQTGKKTLEFHDRSPNGAEALSTSATYNYSPNPDIQELTRYFQGIANTVDFGRKFAYDYRFDKLGMDAHLRSLQDLQASHFVEELQAIEPVLKKIASDPNMMHINRMAARQLLKSIAPTLAVSPPAAQP